MLLCDCLPRPSVLMLEEPRAEAPRLFEIRVPNGKVCIDDGEPGLVSQERTLGILPPKLQLLHDFP